MKFDHGDIFATNQNHCEIQTRPATQARGSCHAVVDLGRLGLEQRRSAVCAEQCAAGSTNRSSVIRRDRPRLLPQIDAALKGLRGQLEIGQAKKSMLQVNLCC
jgi:hypothetical protein